MKKVNFAELSEYVNAAKRPTLAKLRKMYGVPLTNAGKDTKAAMDSALDDSGHFTAIERQVASGGINTFPQFLGYAYLSGLQQNGFIKAGVEGLADDMTESWIELIRTGEVDSKNDDKISRLNSCIAKYGIKDIFNKAATLCGYFGGCLVFLDDGTDGHDLASAMDTKSIEIKNFIVIEPINVYPGLYNSTNPLSADYFKPVTWFVLGKEVHSSRLLYFTADTLGVLLKPAYNFFGVSPAQIAVDSVSHFIKDKEAASRLLHKFSLMLFKIDMGATLYGGSAENVYKRIKLLADFRDNDSIEVIDKEEEDVVQLTTSLAGVSEMVRQSLELMPIMFRQPLTKFLGIAPGGLNATGESDENNWNMYVLSQCEKIFREPFRRTLELLQYQLFGEIDEDISFVFKKRSSRDETARINNNKAKAETDAAYLGVGVLTPDEVRKRLAEDPDSGYNSIDIDAQPEPQELSNNGAFDAKDFDEDKINRADNGEFGSGGGKEHGGRPKKEKKKPLSEAEAFGEAYTEYSGKPESAIDHLVKVKNGHVPAAINKEGIGDIDFTWGKGGAQGFGLEHIIEERSKEGINGIEFLKTIPDAIRQGTVISTGYNTHKLVQTDNSEILICMNWANKERTWMLTAYKKRES